MARNSSLYFLGVVLAGMATTGCQSTGNNNRMTARDRGTQQPAVAGNTTTPSSSMPASSWNNPPRSGNSGFSATPASRNGIPADPTPVASKDQTIPSASNKLDGTQGPGLGTAGTTGFTKPTVSETDYAAGTPGSTARTTSPSASRSVSSGPPPLGPPSVSPPSLSPPASSSPSLDPPPPVVKIPSEPARIPAFGPPPLPSGSGIPTPPTPPQLPAAQGQ